MNLRQTAIAALSVACLLMAGSALAADRGHRDRGHDRGHDSGRVDHDRRGGGYVRDRGGRVSVYVGSPRGRIAYARPRFGPAYRFDWGGWRGGRWHHVWYNGVYGWWWVIGDSWFYYGAPVYPYPSPALVYYDDPVYDEGPPPYSYDAAPPQSAPPVEQSWYYCDSPKGYYPYVRSCPDGWRAVPATPPGNIRGQ